MFNSMKTAKMVPKLMRKATVTTIPKKGSKVFFFNEKGVFIVNSIRSILMRLLYNLNQPKLETHMSDSNVGGRKQKSGINHSWTINQIIHDQLSSVKKSLL